MFRLADDTVAIAVADEACTGLATCIEPSTTANVPRTGNRPKNWRVENETDDRRGSMG
ncbi:hypothetical protein SAMN05421630_10533 [Prauserella marina]|uniref:Uncharacterized protein n=1 Tax=Prauserella marina TaxID=530584 RepID=A0A1G6R1C8_9PSEU|nr:hypothetical protein DES30_10532 [Prauserella marina]SDC98223.1 hypothetical protein SAMN05421630_10533 [Prauserella marina]